MKETKILPMLALRDIAVLPGMLVHFDINRKISIQAVEQAMKSDQLIFTVLQKDAMVDDPTPEELYRVGCVARIKQIIKLPGNLIRVLVTGEERGELDYMVSVSPYFSAQVVVEPFETAEKYSKAEQQAMHSTLKEMLQAYFEVNAKIGKDVSGQLLHVAELDRFMEQITVMLPLTSTRSVRSLPLLSLAL